VARDVGRAFWERRGGSGVRELQDGGDHLVPAHGVRVLENVEFEAIQLQRTAYSSIRALEAIAPASQLQLPFMRIMFSYRVSEIGLLTL
jgi:hypothetical protein